MLESIYKYNHLTPLNLFCFENKSPHNKIAWAYIFLADFYFYV